MKVMGNKMKAVKVGSKFFLVIQSWDRIEWDKEISEELYNTWVKVGLNENV